MKKVLNFYVLVCFLAVAAAFTSCKKTDIPVLTTTVISSITTTSASTGGNITDDGGAEVTGRGVCWGTATKPEITGSKTSDTKGTGSFTSSITGLTPDTKYYVRAYATNSEGTAYGNEQSFTTAKIVGATVVTVKPTTITANTANPGGNVTLDGGSTVSERGICWGTTANPTTTPNKLAAAAAGTGTFTVNLTTLAPGTLYHIRAYAINISGTSYGTDETFTTVKAKAAVTTAAVLNPTQTTATAGGEVTSTGGADVDERGVYYGTQSNPDITGTKVAAAAGTTAAFTCNLTNLIAGTKYYVVAFAHNSEGTSFGTVVDFTTSAATKAILTTALPELITTSSTSVTSGGTITSNGGGLITERGVCWSTSPEPEADNTADFHLAAAGTTSPFVVTMASLLEGTTYYVRAYALNSAGYGYGNEQQVLTMMSDTENNIYKTVKIGNQVWMAENLKTIKYNNNTDIPTVVSGAGSGAAWIALSGPAYCWYNDDEATNKPLYGALYNWFAVNTGNLCPTGWHVPTDAEFMTLEIQLGMSEAQTLLTSWRGTDQGTQMKNNAGWTTGNGTNSSGFAGLPGGYRYYDDGAFQHAGDIAYLWTSTAATADRSFMRQLESSHATVERNNAVNNAGKSVRCVK